MFQRNLSENFKEYYDYDANRAAIISYGRRTGNKWRTIIDFGKKMAYLLLSSMFKKKFKLYLFYIDRNANCNKLIKTSLDGTDQGASVVYLWEETGAPEETPPSP